LERARKGGAPGERSFNKRSRSRIVRLISRESTGRGIRESVNSVILFLIARSRRASAMEKNSLILKVGRELRRMRRNETDTFN
jgi:hypothetical protein